MIFSTVPTPISTPPTILLLPSTPHRHAGGGGGLDGVGGLDVDGGVAGGLVVIISGVLGNNKLVIELTINVAIKAGIMMSRWPLCSCCRLVERSGLGAGS